MWIFGAILGSLICSSIGKDLDNGCVYEKDMTGPYLRPTLIHVRQRGNFYSPGFKDKNNYPNSVQCSHLLQVPAGMHLRIHFNIMDIDVTGACSADSLSVYDVNSKGDGILLTKLCGQWLPNDYVSQLNMILLIFKTDYFAGRKGFNITYSIQSNQNICAEDLKQCKNRNCVDSATVCDGVDDCGDGTDEENCPDVVQETSVCGKPSIQPMKYTDHDRIVGGIKAVQGSWPWMAALHMKIIEPSAHICGGSLINAQWVLAAAHCFSDPSVRAAKDWRIHLGKYNKFVKNDHEQIRYAERIVIHDDIPPEVFEQNGIYNITNDIALIKLNAPVTFSKYVQPVCLPGSSLELTNRSTCYAVGWGATRGSGNPDLLKQAYHPIQPDALCTKFVMQGFTNETMICAGSMNSMNGVCNGDSGGPLHCKLDEVWNVVGVASYVLEGTGQGGICGLKGRPSVFNKVAVKIDYIRKMISKYS